MNRFLALLLLVPFSAIFGQKPPEILATSTAINYGVETLSPEVQKIYESREKLIADARAQALEEMTAQILLELEAKSQGRTTDQLLTAERTKAAPPTGEQIQAFYDENRTSLGGKTFDEVRNQIADYLRQQAEQKLLETYLA